MTENRIVESGVFGPVYTSGLQAGVKVRESIVDVCLQRKDQTLIVELTVEAADLLAEQLAQAVTKELRPA